MRIKKLAVDGIISAASQLITILLGLVSRRIFVSLLSIEYLGYDSVFSNILSILSVADLGMESVIAVKLYQAISNQDGEKTCKLIWIFKWFYRLVAVIVFVGSLAFYPFLPYIVREPSVSWDYLHIVYFMQVAAVIAGYFLSYKRAIFVANQQNYFCSLADLLSKIAMQVLQIVLLLRYQNYLIYLAAKLSVAPLANIALALLCKKFYPHLSKHQRATSAEIKDFGIIPETKGFLIHKISSLVDNAINPLVVSSFCGIYMAAVYGNYMTLGLLGSGVLFIQAFNALRSAVGNFIHVEATQEKKERIFGAILTGGDIYSLQIALGFFLFTQPVIEIWLGSREFLLPFNFLVLYAIDFGILTWNYSLYAYRGVIGDFAADRYEQMLSAGVHLIVALTLAPRLGVAAVVIGSIAGRFFMTAGYAKVIYKDYLRRPILGFFRRRAAVFLLMIFEVALAANIVNMDEPVTLKMLLCRTVIWLFAALINYGMAMFSKSGKELHHQVMRIFNR